MSEVGIILRLQLKMHKLVVHANIKSAQTWRAYIMRSVVVHFDPFSLHVNINSFSNTMMKVVWSVNLETNLPSQVKI